MKNRPSLFVVGATGYVGGALLESASKAWNTYGTSSSGRDNFLALSLENASDFDYRKIKPDDVVFLTAAISSPDLCAREYGRSWNVNVSGTSALIKNVIALGGRCVFFSSDTVYGEREDEFDEHSACNPAGEYAAMKCEVERRFEGNPLFKSIRLSYVFSREDKFSRYLAGCAQRSEEANLFHPFFRAIIHRNDVVAGALALAESWREFPETYINFGGPQVLSRVDFAESLRDTIFHDLRFNVIEPDSGFFLNRPRIISMKSPILEKLLRRLPRSLREAAPIEYPSITNAQRVL
jgi:dTDP-4-dehydrorhamnose reductase